MGTLENISSGEVTARNSFEQSSGSQCLLEKDWNTDSLGDYDTRAYDKKRRVRSVIKILYHAIPWVLLFFLSAWNLHQYGKRGPKNPIFPQLTYSPAQDVLEYEERVFQLGFDPDITPYQGQPSPELDERWLDLYRMGISRVPVETARKFVNETVLFPHDEEKNYVIELDVFHQLHCLNMIRQALHPEYYQPHMVASDGEDELLGFHHIDHCVDTIRQSLMCNVDVSVLVWKWVEERQQNLEVAQVAHTCRNFDKVRDWARDHAIDQWFDLWHREMNDPLDESTWTDGYRGE